MRTTLLLLLSSWALFLFAQPEDASLSPYFVIRDSSTEGLQMPLQHTSASVNISGIIADVTIQQVYQNTGSRPIEAEYVFPASTRAAVYAMQMQIGDRTIEAKIKEKATALEIYEKAQAQGKTASLLQQHRPNIFQMQVANVMPGDSIVIQLQYTELLLPREGAYEFVYPTVVGPRYTGPDGEIQALASPAPQPAKSGIPYEKAGALPTYTFGFEATIQAGMPVDSIVSPTHELITEEWEYGGKRIQLGEAEAKGGNRDLVIRYQLRGAQIQAGLMTYREKGEKFFLSLVEPPKREQEGTHVPREYVFVVDVSGSMSGTPLNNCKALMAEVFKNMDSRDRLNVLMFSGGSSVWSPDGSRPVTKKNLKAAQNFLDSRGAGGGTHLVNALKTALSLPQDEYMPRTFLVCTDGFISVEQKAFDLIRKKRGENTVFTIGIGSSVNRHLIEGIARAGNGESFVLLNQGQAEEVARQFHTYVQHPILTEIRGQFGEMEVYDLEPLNIPNLYASMPIAIVGKYTGKVEGELLISGNNAAGPQQIRMDLASAQPLENNRGLRYLWARKKLERLGDLPASDTSKAAQITQMGLQYNLLTDYTSFVAVQHKRRNKAESDSTVRQLLPLPEGVSDAAVGGIASSSAGMIKEEVGETIAIRGARASNTVYYIDGVKVQGQSSLPNSSLSLDEVVVVGYGSQSSRLVTGTVVSSSSNRDLFTKKAANSLNWNGLIPGLFTQQSSGFSQASPQMTIRGGSSLIGQGQALLVVDGLPLLPMAAWPQMQALSLNPWLSLSGSEMSSLTVLKDPAATFGFGGMGSNGALAFSSKQPRAGDQGWQLLSQVGTQWLSRPWEGDSTSRIGWVQSQQLRYQQWKRKGWFSAHTTFVGEQGPLQEAGFRQIQTNLNGERKLTENGAIGAKLTGNLTQAQEGAWRDGGEHAYRLLRGQLYAKWNLFSFLSWKSQLGGEHRQADWQAASLHIPQQSFLQHGWSHHHRLYLDKSVGRHEVSAQAGFFQQHYSWNQALELDSEKSLTEQFQRQSHIYASGKFSYESRYILQFAQTWQQGFLSGQTAGWKWLPSVSARWNLDEEAFMQGNSFLDQLSLKAGWGRCGQLPQWLLHPFSAPASLLGAALSQTLRWDLSEDLPAWETVDHLQVGLSSSFWEARIQATVEAFQKEGRNLWLPVPIISEDNWTQEIQLLPHLRTRGVEGRLQAFLGGYRNFQATIGLNVSWQQQHIMSLPQGPLTLGATPWNQP
ncbi:MAG: VIT domain-containing protein, partial [Bacteroidota bacterium]